MRVWQPHALVFALGLGALAAAEPARAQTVCITPNCAFAATPAACANRAAPRTPTVFMGSGANLVFDPPNPRIEPGNCILWRSASNTHSSSGSGCPDLNACNAVSPASCQWDSANVSGASATPTATCFYDPISFPADAGNNYYCRIHATPTAGTMRGTLMVTTAINLHVDKDPGASSVKLSWTGGGVAGDLSYKVARQSGGSRQLWMLVIGDSGGTGVIFSTGAAARTSAGMEMGASHAGRSERAGRWRTSRREMRSAGLA